MKAHWLAVLSFFLAAHTVFAQSARVPDNDPYSPLQPAKTAVTGSRMVGQSYYIGYGPGLLLARDSQQYVFVSPSTDQHSQNIYYSHPATNWELSNRETYTYDASGFPKELLSESWNSATWDKSGKSVYTVNTDGYVVKEDSWTWDPNIPGWVPLYTVSYTRDAANRPTVVTRLDWDAGLGAWNNNAKDLYTYNTQGSVTQRTIQSGGTGSSTWSNLYRYDYDYDASGTGLIRQTNLYWNMSSWENTSQYLFQLNSSGKPDLQYTLAWPSGGASWDSSTRATFTYDGTGNQVLKAVDNWTATGFQPSSKYVNTFNTFNQLTSVTVLYWDINAYKLTFSSYQRNYYYEQYTTGIANNVKADIQLALSPVPAGASLHISLEKVADRALTIAVYDMAGKIHIRQQLQTMNGSLEAQIKTSDLPSGNYILGVIGEGGQLASRQFTVLH